MMHSRFGSLITSFWPIYPANTLIVTGTIVTCVCFLGIMGALKENRCMLITVSLHTCSLFIFIRSFVRDHNRSVSQMALYSPRSKVVHSKGAIWDASVVYE